MVIDRSSIRVYYDTISKYIEKQNEKKEPINMNMLRSLLKKLLDENEEKKVVDFIRPEFEIIIVSKRQVRPMDVFYLHSRLLETDDIIKIKPEVFDPTLVKLNSIYLKNMKNIKDNFLKSEQRLPDKLYNSTHFTEIEKRFFYKNLTQTDAVVSKMASRVKIAMMGKNGKESNYVVMMSMIDPYINTDIQN